MIWNKKSEMSKISTINNHLPPPLPPPVRICSCMKLDVWMGVSKAITGCKMPVGQPLMPHRPAPEGSSGGGNAVHPPHGRQERSQREQVPGRVRPPRRELRQDSREADTTGKRDRNQSIEATAPTAGAGEHQSHTQVQSPGCGSDVWEKFTRLASAQWL